ncbi:MAG: asparagine synthase C-terminal domain-containing protein [Candidatus Omnitrophica bacterium]|nr:asparagine synthase C-terminal domain-containing protein [Candidatus Omnitrophota bacterium]
MEENLKKELSKAVGENLAEGLLLSGGLDSAILASLAPKIKGITVTLENSGEDRKYAEKVAKFINIEWYRERVEIEEAIKAIPKVIKILKTFDPVIPNDLAIFFGLKMAKQQRIKTVMTGDGADELFAGYSYMHHLNLKEYLPAVASLMHFSSNKLGKFLGIKIRQPYLNKKFIKFALSVPPNLKLKREKGEIWGKWILRKAFEDPLPREIIWRKKVPIESGSGFSKLREILTSKISDREFEKAQRLPVRFRSEEHFYYYKIYRDVVGDVPPAKENEKRCSGCGTGFLPQTSHCKVCGYCYDERY